MSDEIRQQITMIDRNQLVMMGVKGVESFDNAKILLSTNMGDLLITGEDLHISHLDLVGGEIRINGQIDSLVNKKGSSNVDAKTKGKNMIGRILK